MKLKKLTAQESEQAQEAQVRFETALLLFLARSFDWKGQQVITSQVLKIPGYCDTKSKKLRLQWYQLLSFETLNKKDQLHD